MANQTSRYSAPEFDEAEFEAKMDEFGVTRVKPPFNNIIARIYRAKCGRPCGLVTYEATKEQAALIRMFFDVEGWCPPEFETVEDK